MKIKNNYDECLTNFACSVRKYFGLEYNHETLKFIDEILEEKRPQNVVVILFDGMGSRILDRTLPEDAFFRKNKREITSVFPATTTAATTSMKTGLNPIEHGWLGWNVYMAPISKTITLFLNCEKGQNEVCEEFLGIKDKLVTKTIVDEINEKGRYRALELSPFAEHKYKDLDDMLNMILEETQKDGKKYIYAYDEEPDSTMHKYGPDSPLSKEKIEIRNAKVEKLCRNLKNTLLIVVADHGHIKVDPIFLNDYPEFMAMLERTTSIEERAVSFKVKPEYSDTFKTTFDNLFGEYFTLYEKAEIIESGLFGDGTPNELFEDAIGDYIAIAENSDKCLITDGDVVLASHHAGYTDDEVYVPLIVVDKV